MDASKDNIQASVSEMTPPHSIEDSNLPGVGMETQQTVNIDYNQLRRYRGNPILAMAYGGNQTPTNTTEVSTQLQNLQRGQKTLRRGRVIVSAPQFRGQSVVSQTTANNPYVKNTSGTISFTPGNVPDASATTTNNSRIRYPLAVNLQ